MVLAAVLTPEGWLGTEPHVYALVRTVDGGPDGVGRSHLVSVRSRPYRLTWRMTVVEVAGADRIVWAASGDLAGEARWELVPVAGGTEVVSTWHATAARWWMRATGPLARPLYVRNHHTAMDAAMAALAGHLAGAAARR